MYYGGTVLVYIESSGCDSKRCKPHGFTLRISKNIISYLSKFIITY